MVDGSNPSRPTMLTFENTLFSINKASFQAGFFMPVVHLLFSESQEITTKVPCRFHFFSDGNWSFVCQTMPRHYPVIHPVRAGTELLQINPCIEWQ